jgi:hypothetical protein
MPTQNAEYDVSVAPQVTLGTTQAPWAIVIDPGAPVIAYPDQFALLVPLPTNMIGAELALAMLETGTLVRRKIMPKKIIESRGLKPRYIQQSPFFVAI